MTNLNPLQLERIDKAYQDLFGYAWGTQFELRDDCEARTHLLVDMLGRTRASRILKGKPFKTTTVHKKQQSMKLAKPSSLKCQPVIQNTAPPQLKAALSSQNSPSTSAPTVAAAAAPPVPERSAASTKKTKGVGSLLNLLNGPNKVSTVAKTSMDWDTFKDDTGLGEKLELQAESSTAFLKKQDFLTRVDQRTFELEKKERDRDRIKRS